MQKEQNSNATARIKLKATDTNFTGRIFFENLSKKCGGLLLPSL